MTIQQVQQPSIMTRSAWFLWLLWVLATTVGVLVGAGLSTFGQGQSSRVGFILFQFLVPATDPRTASVLMLALPALVVGLGQGIAQWLVLRLRIRITSWWVLATVAAWALAFLIAVPSLPSPYVEICCPSLESRALVEDANRLIFSAIAGALIGAGQWLNLRSAVRPASWWIPASILGWVAGAVVGMILYPSLPYLMEFDTSVWLIPGPWLIGPLVSGLVTGLMLLWLLRPHNKPSIAEVPSSVNAS